STSSEVPGTNAGGWSGEVRRTPESDKMMFGIHLIDQDYISVYNLNLIAGRNFGPEDFPGVHFGNKVEPVILNRMAMNRLGFTKADEALGHQLLWNKNMCRIVGIVENFHHRSVKEPITPMLFTANLGSAITLKLTPASAGSLSSSIAVIHEQWKKFFPANAFEYFLLEDRFNAQYADDERVGQIFDIFCGLALAVSFLGLFSLSLFSLRLRMKEISIRKILGASMQRLITWLSKEYFLLTLLSIGFSMPLAWLAVRRWLEGFAMHVELKVWYFLAPVVVILLVIVITLCWQIFEVEKKCSVEMLKED
ncbi:MAG TPA: FtsX-like permease family protein, partial [Cyclobacteriaceae bacterium]|nr:FtsX-like permease family protein [Cyclobacteriaceae bacterium]